MNAEFREEVLLSNAACREMGSVETFYPDARPGFGPGMKPDYTIARTICAQCQVTKLCLERALKVSGAKDEIGMFGGMTPTERRRERRRRAKIARDGTEQGDRVEVS